jgi:hypothetical protein
LIGPWLTDEVKLYKTPTGAGWSTSGVNTLVLTTWGAVIPLPVTRRIENEQETVTITHSLFLEFNPEWLALEANRVEHKGLMYTMSGLRNAGMQNRFLIANLRRVQ